MTTSTYTVTIFGAESTGKTTLSKRLAGISDADWLYEFARPYLEQTGAEITVASMTDIWRGQKRLQESVQNSRRALIVQDTDLFSTVGYWQLPHVTESLGPCPAELVRDAQQLRSDLYIITLSNIPFEHDPIRYGGDVRESPDTFWIDVCKRYELPYVVVTASDLDERISESLSAIETKGVTLCRV